MSCKLKYSGFSLTEVLIAVGILAVGMVFVAGVFPVGIYLTTVATERTIASAAADEAFVKIKVYAIGDLGDPTDDVALANMTQNELMDFNDTIFPAATNIDPNEFEYPSADTNEPNQYCWSALFRRIAPDPNRLVQVTVFVSRRANPNLEYWGRNPDNTLRKFDYPVPIRVRVSQVAGNPDELSIVDLNPADATDEKTFINDGYTIVDDATGCIYRILERYRVPNDDTVLLDKQWAGGATGFVWVIPPPVRGGRGPCITVYQKLISF